MSWRLHHEWKRGAEIAGARLATCPHCGTLRSTEKKPDAPEAVLYIKRTYDVGRITEIEPPCIPPPRGLPPW